MFQEKSISEVQPENEGSERHLVRDKRTIGVLRQMFPTLSQASFKSLVCESQQNNFVRINCLKECRQSLSLTFQIKQKNYF